MALSSRIAQVPTLTRRNSPEAVRIESESNISPRMAATGFDAAIENNLVVHHSDCYQNQIYFVEQMQQNVARRSLSTHPVLTEVGYAGESLAMDQVNSAHVEPPPDLSSHPVRPEISSIGDSVVVGEVIYASVETPPSLSRHPARL